MKISMGNFTCPYEMQSAVTFFVSFYSTYCGNLNLEARLFHSCMLCFIVNQTGPPQ